MVTSIDIIKALTIQCRSLLGCDVNDRDISEGFDRPSFFVEINDFDGDDIGERLKADTYNISISYFNEKRKTGYLELLKSREALREMLAKPIKVSEGFSITADDIPEETINKADMTYITTFDVSIRQFRDDIDAPYMEELQYTGNLPADAQDDFATDADDDF